MRRPLQDRGRSGGGNKIYTVHGDFSLFSRLICHDQPYQTQHSLMNIVKYDLASVGLRLHRVCNILTARGPK